LSLLLKRFGPAMMDSLNKSKCVTVEQILECETQRALHHGVLPQSP